MSSRYPAVLLSVSVLVARGVLRVRSWPRSAVTTASSANARQLTYDGRRSGECYFSPDGKQLVFMSEREPGNPFFQIFVLDLETGDIERVSPGKGKATCPFFQAGDGFARIRFDAPGSGVRDQGQGRVQAPRGGHAPPRGLGLRRGLRHLPLQAGRRGPSEAADRRLRLRRGGRLLARRQADRLLLAARRLPRRDSLTGGARSLLDKQPTTSARSTSWTRTAATRPGSPTGPATTEARSSPRTASASSGATSPRTACSPTSTR